MAVRVGFASPAKSVLPCRNEFEEELGDLITEVIIGMGPHGELRYPSYPQANGMWHFPGIGEFQCYDRFLRARLVAAAEAAGQPSWGESAPRSAGHYCNCPHETEFFAEDNGGWATEQGAFFLEVGPASYPQATSPPSPNLRVAHFEPIYAAA